jgi:glutaconyl-CoA/methylmalonyl-CoA decarboxylase subunit gamma
MKKFTISSNGRKFEAILNNDGSISLDGKVFDIRVIQSSDGMYRLQHGSKIYDVFPKRTPSNNYDVWINQAIVSVTIEDAQAQLLSQYQTSAMLGHARFEVRAPMPGMVTHVNVTVGQTIEKDSRLLTLEAMKMENEIRSPMHGKITLIEVEKNSKVEKDQKLIVIEAV